MPTDEGVDDGAVAVGMESLADGCGIGEEMTVAVVNEVALPAPTDTVGAGDEEAATVAVPVEEGTAVPVVEGTTVSEGTPGG